MAEERERLLVVDDEEAVRSLLRRILEEAGYEVFTAANGQQAFGKVLEHRVGLVLLDVKMPGLSGMEVLPKLIDQWPNICVIMVTAMADAGTAIEAMKIGAYDYITKPFNRDDVIIRVKKALEKRHLQLLEEEYKIELQKKVRDQARRLQDQFTELVETLAREHNLLTLTGSKEMLSKLPKELRKPMYGMDEYRDALIRMLRGQV